jgi:tetratricopeptide (TPR) repeat protein
MNMNINKTLLTLTISLQLSFTAIAGQADIDQIEQAAATLNVTELQTITTQVTGYDKALAYYRTGLSANLMGKTEQANQSIDQSIELLEQLDSSTPDDVEIKALLAQVYGYKISLEPIKGMYFGPKSNAKLAEAETLAPNNPRVLLVKGIGKLNTPPMFGGSSEAAYQAFDKAVLAYANDQDSGFHWGYAETYTWRGLVHMQSGETDKAKQDWQLALNINPDYGWAKMLLSQN